MARITRRYGWVPDIPDHRDFAYAAPAATLRRLPTRADMRRECPPVYDQGNLGSCTANAIGAAIEFDERKQKLAKPTTPSRLFIYYNERVMEGTVDSDSGAAIRDGVKSVATIGGCSERLWPYDIAKFRDKPVARCYADAKKHKVVLYQRLPQTTNQLKGCLASGYPFVLGFSVYESFESLQVARTGHAPMPGPKEKQVGGHAVMAVGYDDGKQWFILRNSWGAKWGMKGYFTLPYAYLLDNNLSDDFWTIRLVK